MNMVTRSILSAWMVLAACFLGAAGASAEPMRVIASGEWSKPVADSRGYTLRGRLVIGERRVAEDRREAVIYIELEEASDTVGSSLLLFCDLGRTDFRPEYKQGLRCHLKDKQGEIIEPAGFPFGGAVPPSQWLTLPDDARIRLRASPYGVHRPKALALSPDANGMWVIADGDPDDYFLEGLFTIDPAEENVPPPVAAGGRELHLWRGTLELPAVRIANRMQ